MIAFLGTVLTPILSIIFELRTYFTKPGYVFSFFGTMEGVFLFLMMIFGPLVFTIMGAFLFSREYTEKTLKTLFVVPISKKKFIMSKFVTLFLCILILMTLTVIEVAIACTICKLILGTYNFSVLQLLASTIYYLFKIIYGSILIFAVITPFIYLALRTNGLIIPMIAVAIIVLINVVFSTLPISGFIPWTAVYPLLMGLMDNYGGMPGVSLLIIGVLCIVSMWASISHFEREDIK